MNSLTEEQRRVMVKTIARDRAERASSEELMALYTQTQIGEIWDDYEGDEQLMQLLEECNND